MQASSLYYETSQKITLWRNNKCWIYPNSLVLYLVLGFMLSFWCNSIWVLGRILAYGFQLQQHEESTTKKGLSSKGFVLSSRAYRLHHHSAYCISLLSPLLFQPLPLCLQILLFMLNDQGLLCSLCHQKTIPKTIRFLPCSFPFPFGGSLISTLLRAEALVFSTALTMKEYLKFLLNSFSSIFSFWRKQGYWEIDGY